MRKVTVHVNNIVWKDLAADPIFGLMMGMRSTLLPQEVDLEIELSKNDRMKAAVDKALKLLNKKYEKEHEFRALDLDIVWMADDESKQVVEHKNTEENEQ